MLLCRKCNKRVTEARKICRACGSILEEVPEDLPEAGNTQDAGPTSSVPQATSTGTTEPALEPGLPESESPGVDWKCQECGEIVPGDFDVCWKCMTTKAGERDPNAQELLSDVVEDDQEPEPAESPAEVTEREDIAQQRRCRDCGSPKVVRNVPLVEQGDSSDVKSRVILSVAPGSVFVVNPLYGEIKADVCSECGYIDLRLADPSRLYEHLAKSAQERSSRPVKDDQQSVTCQNCGSRVIKDSSACPHCGTVGYHAD
jgi:RNA polymerase subunit RPABC4/transcription elongation factor Spt4